MLRSKAKWIPVLLFILCSCNDEEAFDCFKTAGEVIELNVPAEPFHKIHIRDGFDVFLRNGPEEKIVIKGGKNLIPKVRVLFEDGKLKVDNENTCNWTREYKRIEMYITAPVINEIKHYGFGNITSLDTLRSDNLKITGQESSGDFNLMVDTGFLTYISNGLSHATISGKTYGLYVGQHFNDGIFNSEDLNARNVSVLHQGNTRIRVRARDSLEGSILLNGILEYYTDDAEVKIDILANGKLIHMGS